MLTGRVINAYNVHLFLKHNRISPLNIRCEIVIWWQLQWKAHWFFLPEYQVLVSADFVNSPLLTPRLHGPLTALAYLITDTNCLLSPTLNLHLPQILFTSSNNLNLGFPILLPSRLNAKIFVTTLLWSTLARCPIHSSLFFLTSATMSKFLYRPLPRSYSPYDLFYHWSLYPP